MFVNEVGAILDGYIATTITLFSLLPLSEEPIVLGNFQWLVQQD